MEIELSLSDWYHDQMPDLIAAFMDRTNPTGAEPVPNAALFNETQNLGLKIQPGKTYLFRVANMAAFAAQYLWFEGHTMRIVEVDGVYTEPAEANMIYLTAAQRASFLVTMKNEPDKNYAFVGSMDTVSDHDMRKKDELANTSRQDLFDAFNEDLQYNVTGWLVYDESKEMPQPTLIDEFNPIDDFSLTPYDRMPLLGEADHKIELVVSMDNLDDGAN